MREVGLDLFNLDSINAEIMKKIPERLRENLIEQINKSVLENAKKVQIYKKAMKLYHNGLGRRRISKILNYLPSTIESWLYGGSKPTPKIKIPTNLLVELKQVGLTNKEIGKILSIHPFTVLQRMRSRKIRENRIFRMSKGIENFIKTEKKSVNFTKYFWLDSSKKEIKNLEKYCRFIKIKDKLPPYELARKVRKSYSVTYNWKRGKDLPRLVRWLEIFVSLGKPKKGFLWLPVNLGSSGIPLKPIIQVPKKIKSWKDVGSVILQLKSKGDKLPDTVINELWGLLKLKVKNYEIIKQILIKTGYFISPYRIENYKKGNLNNLKLNFGFKGG